VLSQHGQLLRPRPPIVQVTPQFRLPLDRLVRRWPILISLDPNVIDVWGTAGALAAKHAISLISVVFLATGDPLSLGLVTSLAHPDGNLTGVPAAASSEELAKAVQL